MNKGFLLAAGIVGIILSVYLWYELGGFIAFLPLFVVLLLAVFLRFRAVNG